MSTQDSMFGTSPFGPLVEHAKQVQACVNLLQPLTEAILAGEFETLDDWHGQIATAEHDADRTKRQIRRHLGKSYWLPVDRADLLRLLHQQDGIADAAEDLAVLAVLRQTKIPEVIHDDFRRYVGMVLDASQQYLGVVEAMGALVDAGFTGKESEKVLKATQEIGKKEWQVDKLARQMIRRMFKVEDQLNPLDAVFCMKIIEALGAVANHAENTGEALALMILRR
jgi:predicted phosphate transport protein (TIGR00153 family)